jgi:transcription initiation factor TFIIB
MSVERQSTPVSCPECAGRVRPHGVERVCSACGLVADTDALDRGPDWRHTDYDGPYNPAKHAAPTSDAMFNRGLGTDDSAFTRRQRSDAGQRTKRHARNRAYAMTELKRIGSALEVGMDMVRQAQYVFRQLHDDGKVHGREMDVLAPTCLYTTLRKHQRGRTPDELAAVARCEARLIARRHRWVCDELGLLVPPPDPEQRLRVVAGKLGASHDTKRKAIRLLARCEPGGEKPSTLAAAVLYEVGPWTQAEASEAAGVSAVALRERWQDMDTDGQTTVAEFGVAV